MEFGRFMVWGDVYLERARGVGRRSRILLLWMAIVWLGRVRVSSGDIGRMWAAEIRMSTGVGGIVGDLGGWEGWVGIERWWRWMEIVEYVRLEFIGLVWICDMLISVYGMDDWGQGRNGSSKSVQH